MNLEYKLIDLLTYDVRVLIWFENEPLSINLPLFKTMDYLMDGLLTHHLQEFSIVNKTHFIHETFEKPFHLIYLTPENDHLEQSLFTALDKEKVVVVHPQLAKPQLLQTIENQFRWVDFWRQ